MCSEKQNRVHMRFTQQKRKALNDYKASVRVGDVDEILIPLLDSINSLVPGSRRLLEKTLDEVRNSKVYPRNWTRIMPNRGGDVGCLV